MTLVVTAAQVGEPAASVPETIRRRLLPPVPSDGLLSWFATGLVVLIGAVLRLVGLSHPAGKMFDEIYYATEAKELLDHGVEWRIPDNGDVSRGYGDFVVHPPLGKWCIAIGVKIFGDREFGWRIAAVVAGVLSILIVVRLARRMFGSTVLGCAAGLLMALDGIHLVLSRTALLDIFLLLFIVAAFACVVMDREATRRRWLAGLQSGGAPDGRRPRRTLATVPWWRFAAGVMIGCALGVKWSAVWYVLAFMIMMYVWESRARRSAGVRLPWWRALAEEGGWIGAFLGFALLTYLATWTGWFVTGHGWDRHWLASQGHAELPIIGPLVNLYHYHSEILNFHTGLQQAHTYQSWPWQWLILGRPVAFFYNGDPGCGAPQCAQEVLLLGTPLLWWSFLPALGALVWLGIARRDWRAWTILIGVALSILPWFYYEIADNRTMFYFYALPAEPFLVMAVVYVLGAIIGRPGSAYDRRLTGTIVAAGYMVLVALCFAWFWPLYVGTRIPYADWWARMLLGNRWV